MRASPSFAAALAALALVFGFAAPASAGWNGTEWGMSLPQVEAKFPGLVRHAKPGDEARPWYNTPGPVAFAGATWSDAGFTFTGDKLSRVELFTDSPAELISASLAAQYGPPVTGAAEDAVVQTVFVDRANGNRLTLTDALFFRSVSYEPLTTR